MWVRPHASYGRATAGQPTQLFVMRIRLITWRVLSLPGRWLPTDHWQSSDRETRRQEDVKRISGPYAQRLMANPDKADNSLFSEVVETLERQRAEGLHLGAQVYVSRFGEPLLDMAIGESVPGRALEKDDMMLWYSSGKPVTTAAVLQLWERGRLGLDDL